MVAESTKKSKGRFDRNRLLLVAVTLAFAVAACIFIYSMGLAEYQGSVSENLSYEVPAGYELVNDNSDGDWSSMEYARETDTTRERLIIYYDRLDGNDYFEWEHPVKIDESTSYNLVLNDWDNGKYNELCCEVLHEPDAEAYEVMYRCQETDKDQYYSSCSEEQQEELVAFVNTFEFHRPSNQEAGNVFKRLYLNYGIAGLVVLGLGILIFVCFPVGIAIGSFLGSSGKEESSDDIISSRDLHDSMNRERERNGETSIPSINNPTGTSSNNLARRDHSWSSVPDFFIKLFRRK